MTPARNRSSGGVAIVERRAWIDLVRSLRGFISLILLIVWLFAWVSACGDEDLIFPGDIPIPTAAPEPTDTPDAEEA